MLILVHRLFKRMTGLFLGSVSRMNPLMPCNDLNEMRTTSMRRKSAPRDETTNRFVYFASVLSGSFPSLDLRFNLESDSHTLRYYAAGTSPEVFQVDLNYVNDLETLVHEAIFNVKEIAQLFDS